MHRFLKELEQYGVNQDDAITGYSYHNLGILYILAKRADIAFRYFADSFSIQMHHNQEPNIEKIVSVMILCSAVNISDRDDLFLAFLDANMLVFTE